MNCVEEIQTAEFLAHAAKVPASPEELTRRLMERAAYRALVEIGMKPSDHVPTSTEVGRYVYCLEAEEDPTLMVELPNRGNEAVPILQ